MTNAMRAVVLEGPGPPEALRIRELPIPEPRPGWVLIQVKAFGLNCPGLHTRLGLAQGVTFPRLPGIEASGIVGAVPGGEFEEGQQAWQ
jgi:NADPH:quinone reductase-like Zn-dependent oxidoreductase